MFYWFIYSQRYINGDLKDHKLSTITITHSEVTLLCALIQGENLCEIHLKPSIFMASHQFDAH